MYILKQLNFKTESVQGQENPVAGALCPSLKTGLLLWFLKWRKSGKQGRQPDFISYSSTRNIRELFKVKKEGSNKGRKVRKKRKKKTSKVRRDWKGGFLEGVVSSILDHFPMNADQEQPLYMSAILLHPPTKIVTLFWIAAKLITDSAQLVIFWLYNGSKVIHIQ